MVCLGNICRSPLAHGILEDMVKKHKLDWLVDSAGTSAYHLGEKPCEGSINVAKRNGIKIDHFKAKQFTANDLDEFDLILAMDNSNFSDMIRIATNEGQKRKIKMILNYSFPNQNRAVPDSFYTGNYKEVFDLLYNACQNIIERHS